MTPNTVVAGLDIGTTKICCVVAEVGAAGELIISGVGVSPSEGLKRGVVVDIEATTQGVGAAVQKAANQSGREITQVYVGVTGEHISSLNSKGVTAITHADREIHQDDVDRALHQARVIVIPPDRVILHAIPRSYSIDGQNGIRHPVGMSGTRLEVETHIVTGAHTFLQNVEKCVARSGLGLQEMVLEPLATSTAVLTPAERSHGVCLIDIGGGTTDMGIFIEGEIYYSAVVPVGGSHVTTDLAQLLRIPVDHAEQVKKEHGHAVSARVGEAESVPIQQIGSPAPRPLRRRAVAEIVEARMQELFQLVQNEIDKSGCKQRLPAGVVITGGGSDLQGALECAGAKLGMPVRQGKPERLPGLGDTISAPQFSTAVGLVQYGAAAHLRANQPSGSDPWSKLTGLISKRFGRAK